MIDILYLIDSLTRELDTIRSRSADDITVSSEADYIEYDIDRLSRLYLEV